MKWLTWFQIRSGKGGVSRSICLPLLLVIPGIGAGWAPVSARGSGEIPATPGEEWALPVAGRDFHATDPQLADLITILLADNPQIRAARARWRSSLERVPQERALPDPQLQIRYFAETPETRVGPQRAAIGINQGVPWYGKRALQGRRASHLAGSFAWEVRALERDLVATLKRAYYDAAYYQEALAINHEERNLLEHFEKIALTRYTTGQGIQQSAVKVQTEISLLLDQETDLEEQLDVIIRRIGQLLGRTEADLALQAIHLPVATLEHDTEELERAAELGRPEVQAALERINADTVWSRRRARESRPDFRFGIEFTAVDDREDRLGRINPPEENGKNTVALVAGINIPLYRNRIRAGISEAQESLQSSEERLASTQDRVRFEVQESALRLDSLTDRTQHYQEVVIRQAEESLASAEAAYVTNRLGFLDLLDAERVLFQARLTYHRLLANCWIAASDLERAVGRRFPAVASEEEEEEETTS